MRQELCNLLFSFAFCLVRKAYRRREVTMHRRRNRRVPTLRTPRTSTLSMMNVAPPLSSRCCAPTTRHSTWRWCSSAFRPHLLIRLSIICRKHWRRAVWRHFIWIVLISLLFFVNLRLIFFFLFCLILKFHVCVLKRHWHRLINAYVLIIFQWEMQCWQVWVAMLKISKLNCFLRLFYIFILVCNDTYCNTSILKIGILELLMIWKAN